MSKSVAQQIREGREAKGWSQAKLADEAGVHELTVCYIEKKAVAATERTIQKLARALEIEVVVK